MKCIPVVAGIIWHEDKVLVAQRLKKDKAFPGMWEFPGGKIELGESPEDALKREIQEELALDISDLKLYDVKTHTMLYRGEDIQLILIYYLAKAKDTNVIELEVEDAKWVSKGELLAFDLTPMDATVAYQLNNLDY